MKALRYNPKIFQNDREYPSYLETEVPIYGKYSHFSKNNPSIIMSKSNRQTIEIGLVTIGALKVSDALKKKYPENYIIKHLTAEVIWLSLGAYAVYFWYIHKNRKNPRRIAYATSLLIASPIPPLP